ncbi:hypothetical protein B0I37DRAFT_447740 [Chaetomium sp. MPI-CAGE-AT-0009]|nr:hypothetical protein B0I37DRAFT_447740 [Chaetomium sp. MPI-CAGE-AT-0009]
MASSLGTVPLPATYPSVGHIIAAAKAVAQALNNGNVKYAIVGGAACLLLGSDRATSDVDFVRSAIEIQIISPPALFKEPFDESTETIEILDGIHVLKPTLILNAKCRSILDRAGEDKKMSDGQDIKFLLHWCADNGLDPRPEVPNATNEFVNAFVAIAKGN